MRWWVALTLVPGLAGCVTLVPDAEGVGCPGHWHATFAVHVQEANGTRRQVRFSDPAFDLSRGMPFQAHMHQSERSSQIHLEQRCIGIQEVMGALDVALQGERIVLEGRHAESGQGGTYEKGAATPLVAYIEHVGDRVQANDESGMPRLVSANTAWERHEIADILAMQLGDGERLLILHGQYSDDAVAQLQSAMDWPSTGRPQRS